MHPIASTVWRPASLGLGCAVAAGVLGRSAPGRARGLAEVVSTLGAGATSGAGGAGSEDLVAAVSGGAHLVLVAVLAALGYLGLAVADARAAALRPDRRRRAPLPLPRRLALSVLATAAVGAPALPVVASAAAAGGPPGPPPLDRPAAVAPASAPAAAGGARVEVRAGDCLWRLAAADLRAAGRPARAADVAAAWPRWYRLNAARIGPDPDLLRVGLVLRAPPPADRGHPVRPDPPADAPSRGAR